MKKWQDDRIGSAISGNNPMVMAELPGGFAVYGNVQFLPGYSVLLPKKDVNSLNNLSMQDQTIFLQSMSFLGEAVLKGTNATRINYDILGNTDNFLHAHVFPRYATENTEYLSKPVWLYPSTYWSDKRFQYNPNRDDVIRKKITKALNEFL